jgi:uncharacterized protein (DUF3084 family)
MSWQNALILFIFVVVCGFIAYWGDLLGRRMGKRRLSLFGLRPRYTAIVTTTITGMLIAIMTIALLAALSSEFRYMIRRGADVVHDYKIARHKYMAALDELNAQKRITAAARSEAESAVLQRDRLADEIASITKDLKRLKADLHLKEAALVQAERNLASAKGDLTSAHREIVARRKDIERRKAEIASLEARRDRLIENTRRYLSSILDPRFKALRERRVIFGRGEELARKVIDCSQPTGQIKSDIMALLSEADQNARKAGSTEGKNKRAIEILPKSMTDAAGRERFLSESENIQAIAEQIAAGSGSVVALIFSVGNSIEAEQALVDIQLYHNQHVYSAGQEVASTVIDGSASRGEVFGQITSFLRSQVRPAAMEKGIIPASDEGGQPSVGQMSGDQILDLVEQLKAVGKTMRIKALAADETWSAGPLMLRMVVDDIP